MFYSRSAPLVPFVRTLCEHWSPANHKFNQAGVVETVFNEHGGMNVFEIQIED